MLIGAGSKVSPLHERIRFIAHQGKQILLVDFSGCSPSQVEEISRTVPEYVTVQPRASVLLLVDFSGASFDEEAMRTMKESAVFDKPFIKRTAWTGADKFPGLFRENLKNFSRREFPTFENREEALAWLVKE